MQPRFCGITRTVSRYLTIFFDTVIGPSTPNALGMFSGQSGLTQWVEHPELSSLYNTTNASLPIVADPQPFWGSSLDVFTPPSELQPVDNPGGVTNNPASNLTYASLGLSFMGSKIYDTTSYDNNVGVDLADVQNDITKIAGDNNKPVNWSWYQEGYDAEPGDLPNTPLHGDYIAHHNAPQYFGYRSQQSGGNQSSSAGSRETSLPMSRAENFHRAAYFMSAAVTAILTNCCPKTRTLRCARDLCRQR